MQQIVRPLLAAGAVMALAGCTVGTVDRGSPGGAPPPTAAAPARTETPPVDIMGAWRLAAPTGGACTMHFATGQEEGTIRPEGGCPGEFYTSRRWTYESNALVIRDHNRGELARLRMASPGHFEGQAANGEQLTLTR